MVTDLIAERLGGRFRSHKSRNDVLETRLAGHQVVLAKPQSYMNDSGSPVASLVSFFKIPVEQLVVVHDELDLPYGELRLKFGGGDNGHNGLKSLRRSLGTGEYLRLRFGIGRPPGRQDPADYVLENFSSTQRGDLGYHVDRAADAVEAVLADGLAIAQSSYNS